MNKYTPILALFLLALIPACLQLSHQNEQRAQGQQEESAPAEKVLKEMYRQFPDCGRNPILAEEANDYLLRNLEIYDTSATIDVSKYFGLNAHLSKIESGFRGLYSLFFSITGSFPIPDPNDPDMAAIGSYEISILSELPKDSARELKEGEEYRLVGRFRTRYKSRMDYNPDMVLFEPLFLGSFFFEIDSICPAKK